jgi:hypothetical protein
VRHLDLLGKGPALGTSKDAPVQRAFKLGP